METISKILDQQEDTIKNTEEASSINISFRRSVHILIGCSGSGKTYLLAELYKRSGYDPKNTIFISTTFHLQDDKIKNTFQGCTMIAQGYEEADYSNIQNKLVIFDDIGKSLYRNMSFINMIINKRHRHNCIIMLLQSTMFVPQEVRFNYEYVYIFKEKNITGIEHLYNNFLTIFESKKALLHYFRRMKGYTFIVSDKINILKVLIN